MGGCVRYHQSVTLLLLLVYGRGFSRTVGWLIIGADPHLPHLAIPLLF